MIETPQKNESTQKPTKPRGKGNRNALCSQEVASFIEELEHAQNTFQESTKPEQRKELGQFFTASQVAEFMASMLDFRGCGSLVRILDAGAGAGILGVSAILRAAQSGCQRIEFVAYETDRRAASLLEKNLEKVRSLLCEVCEVSFRISNEDFVSSRPDRETPGFDAAILNPPYFKYNSRTSKFAQATADLFKGDPNIYASFLAVSVRCLKPAGQLVAIVPRSFTNGLYFRGFREFLSRETSLELVHSFVSRKEVFKATAVLQENVICKFAKRSQGKEVRVSVSENQADLKSPRVAEYESEFVFSRSSPNLTIRIPESRSDAEIMREVESWPTRFADSFFISTGPVVEHRTREFISEPDSINGSESVPLIRMHNVRAFRTNWDGTHRKDARFRLNGGFEKHTVEDRQYILLKRFSAKDEKRRLVAGIYSPSEDSKGLIAIENHLNFVAPLVGEFDDSLIKGMAALLNSSLLDRYFRCISGNTQVNATEMRLIHFPTFETLRELGSAIGAEEAESQEKLDRKISEIL